MSENVRNIVESQLCCQCGTCVAVCPTQAIEMRETPSGMLVASIDKDKCIFCGKCLRFCPGSGIELNLPDGVDPFRGPVYGAYVGHAREESVRLRGQSGGVVTALLLFLMETDQIDAGLVTKMPHDGTLRPLPTFAETRQEILSGQGSKYCPVASNAVLRDAVAYPRIAIVGVPCQIQAIHQLIVHSNPLVAGVQYKLGLFCDRTLLYTCIDQMVRDAGLAIKEIAALEYRSKARNGWPGEVSFHFHTGDSSFFPSSLRMGLKDAFTVPRCRLCFDKTNVFSNISVGDAWGIDESRAGNSVIIVRDAKGAQLIKESSEARFITLKEIDPQYVFEAQGLDIRRKNFVAFSDIWREMKRPMPQFKGLNPWLPGPPSGRAAKRVFKRKLILNMHIAASKTRQRTFAIVRRHRQMQRIKEWTSGLVRSVLRF